MSKPTSPARRLAALAAVAFALVSLTGCTLVTTLAGDGGTASPTETTPAETDTSNGEAIDSPAPDPTTPAPTASEDGMVTDFFYLKVGDCFDIPDDQNGVALLYSSCDVPHLYEAYSVEVMPGDEYPGDDAVIEYAKEMCTNAFQGYVGSSPGTSVFRISYIYPTEGTWTNMNDREIMCALEPRDGTPVTGSARDSRR